MDWSTLFAGFGGLLATVAVPYGLALAQQAITTQIRDQRLAQWATGAVSFAGQAYADLVRLRASGSSASLSGMIEQVVRENAAKLLASYATTAMAIGAGTADAQTRLRGELGKLLAADPTVTVQG